MHASGSGKVCEDGSALVACSAMLCTGVCQANFLWSNKLLLPFLLSESRPDVEGVQTPLHAVLACDNALVGVEIVEIMEYTEEVVVCVVPYMWMVR